MVEELLRWVTPVLHHSRWPNRTHEVGGQTISDGDRVTLWMVSANHDEAAFERADVLDIGRQPNQHVALGGGGPHYCLGAHLARLETVVTFEVLRPWLERIEMTAAPERVRSNFINGMKHLQVAVVMSGPTDDIHPGVAAPGPVGQQLGPLGRRRRDRHTQLHHPGKGGGGQPAWSAGAPSLPCPSPSTATVPAPGTSCDPIPFT